MAEPAETLEPEPEPGRSKRLQLPLWATLLIGLAPNAAALVTTFVKTSAANRKADAGYEAMKEAVQLLQSHDTEHIRSDAAIAAHIQVIEAWLGSMRSTGGEHATLSLQVPQSAPNERTWRPNFPPALQTPVQHKIEFRPSLDDLVDDIKSGRNQYVHEVYEGPPEGAPQWTEDAKRAAAAEAK